MKLSTKIILPIIIISALLILLNGCFGVPADEEPGVTEVGTSTITGIIAAPCCNTSGEPASENSGSPEYWCYWCEKDWFIQDGVEVILTSGQVEIATTTTNSKGEYTFTGVPPGENYVITAYCPGKEIPLVKDVVPKLAKGGSFNAGTTDLVSTSLGLVVDYVTYFEAWDPEDISLNKVIAIKPNFEGFPKFKKLIREVRRVLENCEDVDADVELLLTLCKAAEEVSESDMGCAPGFTPEVVEATEEEPGPGPTPPDPTKGSTVGTIMVPEGNKSRDISGWVPLSNATVTLTDSTGKTHTVTTDENGNYTFSQVAPGSNYIITATGEVAGNTIVLKDIVPQLKAGEEYDAGTADAESTALALVVEDILDKDLDKDIEPDLNDIQQSTSYNTLVNEVLSVLEQHNNVTTDPEIKNTVYNSLDEMVDPWDGLFSNSNVQWEIKNDQNAPPGPNNYSNSINNVWKDDQGNLHLRIIKRDGEWYCAEVNTLLEGWGYGKYEFELGSVKMKKKDNNGNISEVNYLDEQIVFGLFTYDGSDGAHKSNNEIDIEFAQWGDEKLDNGNYVVWYSSEQPQEVDKNNTYSFQIDIGDDTSHSFEWHYNKIIFSSNGFDKEYPNGGFKYKEDYNVCTTGDGKDYIPIPRNEKVCLNLYLYKGKDPSNDNIREVEVVIKSFNFTEDSTPNESCILNVPYRTTTIHNGCLCAAGAMVFSYYGIDLSQEYFAEMVIESDSFINELFNADDFGHPLKMVNFAKSFGFNAELSLGLTIDEIKQKLKEGVPVIALQYSDTDRVFPEGLHYRVITGYDDGQQSFIASCSQQENYLISYANFLSLNVIPGNLDICPSIIIESDGIRGWVDVDPKSGEAPHEVSLIGFICGGVIPYTYQWDFGDGNWSQKGIGNQYLNIHHIYEQSDIYSPILHVEDGNGDKKQFKTAEVTVTDGDIPEIGAWTITGYDPYCIKVFGTENIPDRSILVHWPKIAGAEEYRVYRSVNGNSNFSLVYSGDYITDELDVDDRVGWYDFDTTPGNSYSYKVSCVINVQESVTSDPVTRSVWLPECSLVSPQDYDPEDPNYQPIMEPDPLLEWNPVGVSSYPYQGDIQSGESQIWVVAYNTPYPEVNQGEQIWNESFNDLTTSSTRFDPSTPLIPGPDSIHAWESKGVGFDDNGNILAISWSGARHFFYMEAPDEGIIVQFEDPNLEQVVRETINKPSGPLYLSDVIVITTLEAEERGIVSLEGIQRLQNLIILNFEHNQVSDISPLSNLTNLQTLYFSYTQVSDISPLSNLTNLQTLFLGGGNPVSDISPLSNLINLKSLIFSSTQVSDISPLSNLTNLQTLYFGYTQVSNISTLSNLTNLNHLYFGGNQVSNISTLSNLTNLTHLWFPDTPVSDISPLSNLTNLQTLYFQVTPVSDISPLSNLTTLQDLNFEDTQVSDINPLSNLTNLVSLHCQGNQISDISPLVNNAGFGNGDYVDIKYNYLDLSEGSQDMQDIQTLINRGADVEYEPQQNIFPDAPTLSCSTYYPSSGTDYDLTWTDVSDGYEIEESEYSNFSSILSGYSTMDTSWTFGHDVTSDTSYYYRVRSLSSEGYYSEWSNKVEVVVNAIKTSITVETRDHNSTLISGSFSYILYDDSNPWNVICNSGSSSSNSYTFNNLDSGTYNVESYKYNDYSLPGFYGVATDIAVSEGQSKNVTIYTSAISVCTKDSNGNLISGSTKYILYDDPGWNVIDWEITTSNPYTFTGVAEGTYNVESYDSDMQPHYGTVIDISLSPGDHKSITITYSP